MLSGFNNNFRYRGILFHVQTEDSGVSNPHVITHLFHGGNILSSEKLDYSEKLELGEDELEEVVRELMETQHKAMLKRLQRGLHDKVILERLGADAFSEAPPSERSDIDAQLMGPDDDGSDTATAGGVTAEPALPPGPLAPPGSKQKGEPLRAFGESVVSQKPLDEVVLEYLVENARKRKRKKK
jgi:hypothetical protein